MRRGFSAAVLTGALAVLASAPGLAADALRVDETRIEVGEIKAGSEAVATFVLHNDSDHDVRILRAKPS